MRNKFTLGNTALGDYSLSLLDTAGQTLITSGLSGKVSLLDAHADVAGNWYILGTYYDTLRLTSGTLVLRGTNGNEPDHFIARLNGASLNTDWIKMTGTTNGASASCFTIANGAIYLPVDSANDAFYCTRECRCAVERGRSGSGHLSLRCKNCGSPKSGEGNGTISGIYLAAG